ncbi:hypothetical protein [Zavarzinella formosa]|uniref:hypothetical protein n=1 Tax=Zavarzinella formosa TaxID=360055 RepID=UPI0003148409|nr:hypothetical protein [Zavarzinella formosa]
MSKTKTKPKKAKSEPTPEATPEVVEQPAPTIDVTVNAQSGEVSPPNVGEIINDAREAGTLDPVAEVKAFNTAGELLAEGTVNLDTGEVKVEGTTAEATVSLTDAGAVAIGDAPPVVRLNAALAYDSPEAIDRYDIETAKLLAEAEKECQELEERFDDAHAEAARCKKAFEAAVESSRELNRERQRGRGQPPKPVQRDITDPTTHHAAGEDSPDWDRRPDDWKPSEVPSSVTCTQDTEKPDDTWKAVPLSELVEKDGLPSKVAEILSTNGLDTLGKVTDYTNPNATGWSNQLTDLKGFGPKKLEQWQDACSAFWARRNDEERKRRTDAKDHGPSIEGAGGEPASAGGSDVPISKPAEDVEQGSATGNGEPSDDAKEIPW